MLRNIYRKAYGLPSITYSWRAHQNRSTDIICNADMRIGEIRQFCKLPEDGQSLMRAVMSQLNLSARAYHRTQSVKLARTIADLVGCEAIQSVHLAEAQTGSSQTDGKLAVLYSGDILPIS